MKYGVEPSDKPMEQNNINKLYINILQQKIVVKNKATGSKK